jgi:membrane-associated phospholipid phosphatase
MTMIAPRGAPIYWMLACCACVQRVSFNAHWPSDVLIGAAIGLVASALVFALPFPSRKWSKHHSPSACASLPSKATAQPPIDGGEIQR